MGSKISGISGGIDFLKFLCYRADLQENLIEKRNHFEIELGMEAE